LGTWISGFDVRIKPKLQIPFVDSLCAIFEAWVEYRRVFEASSFLLTAKPKEFTYDIDAAIPGYGDDSVEGAEISANNRHVGAVGW
jgi:hypothetical protein